MNTCGSSSTTASASRRRCATRARIVRNHLLPAFGDWRLEDVTADAVERWARSLGLDRPLANRSEQKIIVVFHGLMERARRV